MMNIFKRFFGKSMGVGIYQYNIIDFDDDDGDAIIDFSDGKLIYMLDLEWSGIQMDVEFGVSGAKFHDTTNQHNQYKVMNTIAHITRVISDTIARESGKGIQRLTFKSSNYRNGKIDNHSADIRNRFFARYVIRQFPNATIEEGENNTILIRLNRHL